MAEFISREATIKRIKEVYCIGCNSYNGVRCRACGTGDAIDMIEDAPAADAQGIKERIAMDIERYGDVKVVSIVSDRGREEQLRMKGAKL